MKQIISIGAGFHFVSVALTFAKSRKDVVPLSGALGSSWGAYYKPSTSAAD